MRPTSLSAALLLPVALLVGCTDSGSPTRPTDPTPARPVANGAQLIRGNFGTAFGGAPNPLVVMLGFDIGVTPADVCGGTFTVSDNSALIVLTPPGGFLAGAARGHDLPVQVFEFAGIITNFCDLVGAPLVATGNANYTAPFLAPSSGAVVGHVTVDGIVNLVVGGQARLFGSARATVRPDGTVLFDEELVRLTTL
jgi:hypothetical protein